MAYIIEEIDCASVDEFIAKLSPFHAMWRDTGGASGWVFRGQADATWGLVPSAMRDRAFLHYGIGTQGFHDNPTTATKQVELEEHAVIRFANECVRVGRALPEDSQWLRNRTLQEQAFEARVFSELAQGIEFPLPVLRSVYALAQHHGVPTRLLDWTYDPTSAAYFACLPVARWQVDPHRSPAPDLGSGRLAVWALRARVVFAYLGEWRTRNAAFSPTLEDVEAPHRDNPRLAAQRAMFTLVVHKVPQSTSPHAAVPHPLPTVEHVLRAYETAKYGGPGERDEWPFLRKITLHHADARSLLRVLGEAGFTAANYDPSYDGVNAGIEERRFWR